LSPLSRRQRGDREPPLRPGSPTLPDVSASPEGNNPFIMKRASHHPDQLSLGLGFIRRIVCAGASVENFSNSSNKTGKSCRSKDSKIGKICRKGTEDGEKFSFPLALRRQRKSHGFTQDEAAEILQICVRTYRNWEKGKIPLKPAEQRGIIDTIRSTKTAPGRATLDQMKKSHHLDWEDGKGWRLRVTVDLGRKVVGKRLSLRLGTYTLEEAIQRRKLALNLLAKLGLNIRVRLQKRKNDLVMR